MHPLSIAGSALVATIVLAGAALPSVAQEIPRRKSGLWEITMESSNSKGGPARTMSQCVDQAKDDIARQIGQQMERENKCSRTNVSQSPGKLSFDSSCDFGSMKLSSHSTITGDFNSAYRMEIQSKYSPPMMGMSEGTTIMEAKHMGACKPGQRPGDMTMPGGMTMNVYDMMDGKKK